MIHSVLRSFYIIGGCVIVWALSSCGFTSTGPGLDIVFTDTVWTATGGDIRGVWYPNTPALLVTSANLSPGVRVTPTFSSNTGTGTWTFEGTTATLGTYTYNAAFSLNINGTMRVNTTTQTTYLPLTIINVASTTVLSGNWAISNSSIILWSGGSQRDTIPFTVNDKGLFFIRTSDFRSQTNNALTGNVYFVFAFKR